MPEPQGKFDGQSWRSTIVEGFVEDALKA